MTEKTDWDIGKKEAKELFRKYKPKSTKGVIKVRDLLQKRLKTVYASKPIEWINGYGQGAYSVIEEFQIKREKKFWKK